MSTTLRSGLALAAAVTLPIMFAAPAMAATPATEKLTVPSFASDGTLASGQKVTDKTDETVSCSMGDQASPAGITSGTHQCGAGYQDASACVVDPLHTGQLLCSYEVGSVVRYTGKGLTDTKPASDPVPMFIALDNGRTCKLHTTGAWPQTMPGTHPLYACNESGDSEHTTFVISEGKDALGAFDTSAKAWTVKTAPSYSQDKSAKPETHTVTEAWYVAAFEGATASSKPSTTSTETASDRGVAAPTGVEDSAPSAALISASVLALAALAGAGFAGSARRRS